MGYRSPLCPVLVGERGPELIIEFGVSAAAAAKAFQKLSAAMRGTSNAFRTQVIEAGPVRWRCGYCRMMNGPADLYCSHCGGEHV